MVYETMEFSDEVNGHVWCWCPMCQQYEVFSVNDTSLAVAYKTLDEVKANHPYLFPVVQ